MALIEDSYKINQSFLYEALHEQHNIRILWLHPGHPDSQITCDLSVIDLDECESTPPYEAISYVWGDATDQKSIVCNGEPFLVTKSLFEALQVFRYPEDGKPRALWADGICIDQDNIPERNQQVQLMRQIYTKASKVLIWLGHEESETVGAGLALVCRIAGTRLKSHEAPRPRMAAAETLESSSPPCVWLATTSNGKMVKMPPELTFEPSELQNLLDLFGCQWFNRLWVIQEIALSRAAEVYWGNGTIDFMLIGLTVELVYEQYRPHIVEHSAFLGLEKSLIMFYCWTRTVFVSRFFQLLMITRRSMATDPRDKVFGILGLPVSNSDSEEPSFVDPDYSLSTAEVYTGVAWKMLLEQKDLGVLSAVQHVRNISDACSSWVPDWRAMKTMYIYDSERKTGRDTDTVVHPTVCPCCYELSPGKTISVRGIAIDLVHDLLADNFSALTTWPNNSHAKSLQVMARHLENKYNETTIASTLCGGVASDDSLFSGTGAEISDYRAFLDWDTERHATGTDFVTASPETSYKAYSAGYLFFVRCEVVHGRRFFITKGGMLGLGPLAMEEKDVLVVLFGGAVPFILRPFGDGQHYRLVGECYVHDIMNGEAFDEWEESGELATDFHLY